MLEEAGRLRSRKGQVDPVLPGLAARFVLEAGVEGSKVEALDPPEALAVSTAAEEEASVAQPSPGEAGSDLGGRDRERP